MMTKSNRKGFLRLRPTIVEDDLWFQLIDSLKLRIYRCEYHYAEGYFEYTCISPSFDVLDEGEVIPVYSIVVHQNEGYVRFEVHRCDPTKNTCDDININ